MKFHKAESTLSAKPFKERIRWYQERAKEVGSSLTWQEAKSLANEPQGEMYKSDEYTVLVYRGKDADMVVGVPEFRGMCDYLSIRANSREPCHNWYDFWLIKNYFCGEDREALEIYPSAKRLVDAANQYHLIVMPEGVTIPFGMEMRRMVED